MDAFIKIAIIGSIIILVGAVSTLAYLSESDFFMSPKRSGDQWTNTEEPTTEKFNKEESNTEESNKENQISTLFSTHKYNTVCDLGATPKEIMEKPLSTTFEIQGGIHNDNKYIIEFFKTNEIIGSLNINPDQIYGENGNANYDPIFFDVMFLMPVSLQIMDASPELIKTLSVVKDESQYSYMQRIVSQLNKCN